MAEICGGCNLAIEDQYMFHVLDKSWHANCLLCVDCKIPQTESCFYRDGLILCKNDFTRRFGTRCAGCNTVLERQDLVRRARDLVFHVKCFRCGMCQKTLDTGEQLYVVGGNRFICKDDYLSSSVGSEECGSIDEVDENVHEEDDDGSNEAVSPECHNFQDNNQNQNLEHEASTAGSGDDKNCDDGGLATKRRGPRTTIKSKQLETLKAAFAATPKPTRHMREQLAAETGLNMRVIQVWFQNRRSKERRMKQSRIACGFRPPRRNRQNQSIRPEEANGVYCDVLDPMQQQDPSFYPPGIPPPPGFFPTQEQSIYPNIPPDVESNGFPRPDHQQLEALAAAVHVSSGDYHLEEVLIQSASGINGSSALPVW